MANRLNEFMTDCRFQRCEEDIYLFLRYGSDGLLYLLLYVDDVLVIVKYLDCVEMIQKENLGEAKVLMGLQIVRDRSQGTIKLSQLCINAVLKQFGVLGCKPLRTPMNANS